MDNQDIEYIFRNANAISSQKESLDTEGLELVNFIEILSNAATARKMPICFSYSQAERELFLSFKQPYTFASLLEQLVAAIDWVLVYKVERCAVYVALFPRISQSFRDAAKTIYPEDKIKIRVPSEAARNASQLIEDLNDDKD